MWRRAWLWRAYDKAMNASAIWDKVVGDLAVESKIKVRLLPPTLSMIWRLTTMLSTIFNSQSVAKLFLIYWLKTLLPCDKQRLCYRDFQPPSNQYLNCMHLSETWNTTYTWRLYIDQTTRGNMLCRIYWNVNCSVHNNYHPILYLWMKLIILLINITIM